MTRPKNQIHAGSPPSSEGLLLRLQREAEGLGLDRLGAADPRDRPDPRPLQEWLRAGRQAGMHYLRRHAELRLDPDRLFPGVRSILSAAIAYRGAERDARPCFPRISRYALGEDYHAVLKRRLHRLLAKLGEWVPGVRGRVVVDTAPVLERHWAERAGVGWVGRHGCLIVPGLGSWVFLGEILLDLPLPRGEVLPRRCGSCDRCLRGCPTGALVAPGVLDARRCIAYWTVEHRGPFTAETPRISPWLFGCDVCQEVCPWNHGAPAAGGADPAESRWPLPHTALARTGLAGLERNARRLAEEQREP